MMGFQGSPKLGHSQELALGIIASGWLTLGEAFKRLPTGNQTGQARWHCNGDCPRTCCVGCKNFDNRIVCP